MNNYFDDAAQLFILMQVIFFKIINFGKLVEKGSGRNQVFVRVSQHKLKRCHDIHKSNY